MNFKATAISSFAKFMLGGLAFNKIKDIVSIYNNEDLTGDQKREAALKDVKDLGMGIATWAVNLGIELAVAFLKSKAV